MTLKLFASIAALSFLAGCHGLFDSKAASIAGDYTLQTVDDHELPCCAQTDSTGTRTTIVSGTLSLGTAAPERFVITPAGWYPSSCVHEVPNGGTSGPNDFPRCGDGLFTLTLVQRFDYPDGSSRTTSTISSGLYAWSERDPTMLKLVDALMIGPISAVNSQPELSMQRVNFMGTYGPTYVFVAR